MQMLQNAKVMWNHISLLLSRLQHHRIQMSGYWIQVVRIICVPFGNGYLNFKNSMAGLCYMGNDNPCKTTEIGSIKLRNHDGSTRILRDVRYVPKLKKNLISLKAL